MGAGHPHPSPHPRERREWGAPPRSFLRRLVDRARSLTGPDGGTAREAGSELPLVLRRSELGPRYVDADERGDHPSAAATAAAASERAIESGEWWQADAWAHRALWHYEQADMTLEAARQARRIGDLRTAAGDPESARRYYAEAIDEARDIGAEREQGLAALGLGRAHLDMGEVTTGRRLARAAIDLLERSEAPAGELETARALLGSEVAVGEGSKEDA